MPFTQAKKSQLEIWKLLHATAQRQQRESSLSCPDCGMTLAEFREKGRLGCPRDYEIFRDHLDQLLGRVHNSDRHTGRLPGGERVSPQPKATDSQSGGAQSGKSLPPKVQSEPTGGASGTSDPGQPGLDSPAATSESAPADDRKLLSEELQQAIQDEDYERAAELRDALAALGSQSAKE